MGLQPDYKSLPESEIKFCTPGPRLMNEKKKSRNGDTLGPVELNVGLEQGNQGNVNRMTRVRYLSSYLE